MLKIRTVKPQYENANTLAMRSTNEHKKKGNRQDQNYFNILASFLSSAAPRKFFPTTLPSGSMR